MKGNRLTPASFDVAVIGGGPAGQAAAQATLAAGLTTVMVDEQMRPGGQILRQPPIAYGVVGWMRGRLYRPLRRLLAQTETHEELTWMGGTSVAGMWPKDDGFVLHLSGTHGGALHARRVLIAAGCYDMPVAMPGWTLPGVMSAGGVQTLIKAQQVRAGERFVLFGTHPLQLLVAQQLVAAGAQVAAVLFAQSRTAMIRAALPHMSGAFATPGPLLAAFGAMVALRRAGVPVIYGAAAQRLGADETGQALGWIEYEREGQIYRIACDSAAQCFGFLPQSDLPRQVGAQVCWAEPAGGWATACDSWQRSTVPGLYVAGETTGVAGAELAMVEGSIAGLAMAVDSVRIAPASALTDHRRLLARVGRLRGFAALLRAVADPNGYLPRPDDDTLLCRCEDVSFAAVQAATGEIAALATPTASAVKQRCRIGMGLCQGRSCEHSLIRHLAGANGCSPNALATWRTRFPVRPLPIDEVIGAPM